jgi:phosphohistidine phosphatase
MKTLTLLRHAKSDWDDTVQRDFDRPLNTRGRRAARTVGREMKRLGLAFDLCIASPAVRVRETLGEVEAAFGALAPSFDQRIYLADPDALLELVRSAPEVAGSLLLVGHNPGLEMLALSLAAPGISPMRGELVRPYPRPRPADPVHPATRPRFGAGSG